MVVEVEVGAVVVLLEPVVDEVVVVDDKFVPNVFPSLDYQTVNQKFGFIISISTNDTN